MMNRRIGDEQKTQQDYYEFLDLSGVDDNERNELKSTLYEDENEPSTNLSRSASGATVVSGSHSVNNSARVGHKYGETVTSNVRNSQSSHSIRDGSGGYGYQQQRTYYQSYSNNNSGRGTAYQPRDNNVRSVGSGGAGSNENNLKNRPRPTTWIKNRKFQPQQQQQQQNQLGAGVTSSAPYSTAINTTKRYQSPFNSQGDNCQQQQARPSLEVSANQQQRPTITTNNSNALNQSNGGGQNTSRPQVKQRVGQQQQQVQHHSQQDQSDSGSKTSGGGVSGGSYKQGSRRTSSLNSCYSTDTSQSVDNSGSWNDDDANTYGKHPSYNTYLLIILVIAHYHYHLSFVIFFFFFIFEPSTTDLFIYILTAYLTHLFIFDSSVIFVGFLLVENNF